MKKINSVTNPIIKAAVRLRKAGERQERGLIMIDGAREIELAVRSGCQLETLFYCPDLASVAIGKLFGVAEGKIIELTAEVFSKICYKENPDGFLAIAPRPTHALADIKLSQKPLVIILERVEKPGNLGAILRTAYAAQVDAVIINDSQTDIYNPNVIRASEGYVFSEPTVSASFAATIGWLKKNKIKISGAATGGHKLYTAADWRGPVAIVLGSEADGLSPAWLAAADELVRIPMASGMDSLNVSVAAAIIAFEAVRQRNS